MREVLITDECLKFVEESSERTKEKFNYVLQIITEQRIVHKAFVDKIVKSDYYELRIKAENQIRIILFSIDHSNFNSSKKVILLNGFLKKNKSDYKKAIKDANAILKKYKNEL